MNSALNLSKDLWFDLSANQKFTLKKYTQQKICHWAYLVCEVGCTGVQQPRPPQPLMRLHLRRLRRSGDGSARYKGRPRLVSSFFIDITSQMAKGEDRWNFNPWALQQWFLNETVGLVSGKSTYFHWAIWQKSIQILTNSIYLCIKSNLELAASVE